MALDTKEKRAAVIGVGRPWMRDKFPVVTPDEEWRISSGNAYGGNALSPLVGVFFGEIIDFDLELTQTLDFDLELTQTLDFDLDLF